MQSSMKSDTSTTYYKVCLKHIDNLPLSLVLTNVSNPAITGAERVQPFGGRQTQWDPFVRKFAPSHNRRGVKNPSSGTSVRSKCREASSRNEYSEVRGEGGGQAVVSAV